MCFLNSENLESNMENPADVYTTGIPMSENGNFDHNKNGCDKGGTVDDTSVISLGDHDYPNNSHFVLKDSACDNNEFIDDSIQDGFQSDILCSFECDAGLQPDLPMAESSSLEMESVSESDTHINFSDSPGTSFEKIESFSSVEGLVQSLDEQLDSYLLPDFKSENKDPSTAGENTLESEQRNVTEAICDIAKSFGLEDLLPDTFQVDGNKDGFCVTVTTDDLCTEDAENIGELSLGDFDKCSDLQSPGSSLSLGDHLGEDENYVLSGLDILSPRMKVFDSCISSKFLLKGDQSKLCSNSKDVLSNEVIIPTEIDDSGVESEIISNQNNSRELDGNSDCVPEDDICEAAENLVSDIPTVSISDVKTGNSLLSSSDQNCPPAGSVLITTDKASKKMQIVLTLEQGQQIYDIDTESVDASQQPLDLGFPTSFCDKLQEAADKSLENCDMPAVEQVDESVALDLDKAEVATEKEISELDLPDYITIPAPKGKKNKTWICPVEDCGQVLDKECKLRVHMISHKGARPFKCTFEGCDWAFTTPYRLRRHEETHLGSKDYVCDFEGCNRKFTTIYNLKTHKKRHKWPNSLTCPSKDCKMSFANRRKLELHLRVHKDVEAPYKCSICGKQYYSANCIASHYRTHQYNEDDFKCPFQDCGKVYDKICRLRQHIRHHTGDRPYTCPAEGCKWSFMSASKLTRHMRKHTGERKFVCTEPGCGKSFMRPEHLKGHVVIHSGDKPFHCPHENCNARFTAKSSLYVHVKKHCPSLVKIIYSCPVKYCIKKYYSKATLKQHVQKIHPEAIQNGETVNIAEKLELVMPVSVVNQAENSLEVMDFDELITDDPSPEAKIDLLPVSQQDIQQTFLQSSSSSNSRPVVVSTSGVTCKTVSKSSSSSKTNAIHSVKEPAKSRTKQAVKCTKLLHVNKWGCARTDYCCNYMSKKSENQANYLYLNHNSNDNTETKSFLINNKLITTDIKSPDVMLTSSIIYDNLSEHLIKNTFSPDSSISHGLYHDDSILASSSFGHELIPVSLLSDGVDSDESVLNPDSAGIVFSEHNGVDAFSDSIHLHGLD